MSLKEKIKEAIIEWDEDGLRAMCQSAIEGKDASAAELLNIIGDVMRFIGEQFENEQIFLPDLIGSADTVKTIIDEILDPAIRASGEEKKTKGKVVLGTVESDVHSIGKDLVGSFLFISNKPIHISGWSFKFILLTYSHSLNIHIITRECSSFIVSDPYVSDSLLKR